MYLFDFGWGDEYGFVRLPELNFDKLWYLLLNSNIDNNIYGSASVISKVYFNELYEILIGIFNNPKDIITQPLKRTFKILGLEKRTNKSSVEGKGWLEIDRDYRKWIQISEKVEQILSCD